MKLKTFLSLIFLSLNTFAQTWQQLPDFPSTERDDGASFVIGYKAYCGTGLKVGWTPTNDFYSLDMVTNIWDTINSMPAGTERQ